MIENRQYLRIGLMGADYLLPNTTSYVIEKRENLEINSTSGELIAAWQKAPGGRAAAYSVDANLVPVQRDDWQRAVFLKVGGQTIGLIADELQLLARDDVRIEPFLPLGPAPTSAGHIFNGAWARDGQTPILVFVPQALAAYLKRLESQA